MRKENAIVFIEIDAGRFNRYGKPIVSNSFIANMMAVKVNPDGSEEVEQWITNPLQVDPGADFQDHQIGRTPFVDIANDVYEFINGCDLAGFGIRRLDLPLLAEEFNRCGFPDFPSDFIRVIDIQSIYHQMEKRDFPAAVKFYLGKDYQGNRNSADATLARLIYKRQLEMYRDMPRDRQQQHDLCAFGKQLADFAGLLYWDDTAVHLFWNFGKLKDQQVTKSDPYTKWFLQGDFPAQAKRIVADYTDLHPHYHIQHNAQ